jgi:hypothetical protein
VYSGIFDYAVSSGIATSCYGVAIENPEAIAGCGAKGLGIYELYKVGVVGIFTVKGFGNCIPQLAYG